MTHDHGHHPCQIPPRGIYRLLARDWRGKQPAPRAPPLRPLGPQICVLALEANRAGGVEVSRPIHGMRPFQAMAGGGGAAAILLAPPQVERRGDVQRARDEQPRPQRHRGDGHHPEHRHPHAARHPGEPGEQVGV